MTESNLNLSHPLKIKILILEIEIYYSLINSSEL